ncbi:eukaryotic translation initiation factor 4G-like [Olea europaea var. sylvestris]|uniref:eukaryotic translation initiation factor 4G-like n=1 Tax=Olea europaea var. sylvestris TaxID=158386 RepID=UPI000C1CF5F7|nr:eukaryotic translation initiation factor 4G-like [Olea europaea var. sylvestris]
MSHNQSRAEGNQSTQNRKFGRSGSSYQQRQFSGNGSNKGGVAAALTSSGSFKKYNKNAKGGQSRAGTVSSDSSTSSEAHVIQNGGVQLRPNNGIFNTPVSSTSVNVKPANVPPQKITQVVPRVPSSNVSTVLSHVSTASSEFKAPATPAKGDTSGSFPLQFGSITPGFMNGIQIPARTSSAPPNLVEQKGAQARHDSLRSTSAMQTPSMPKQQLPKKAAGVSDLPNAGEAQSVSKLKRDAQFSSAPPLNQAQRPVHPMPGMSMQLQFHQPHVSVQFGGPNPQIQSQAMMPMSIPMALPLGNSPVQQRLFVPGLPPLPMQSQGMMHQGQGLNFSSVMGPHLPSQLGNVGINMAHQFPQQQAGKYVGPRRTVKITHPDTHEELRLDGSPVPKSNPNVPPQSQPIPSFSHNHPMNYYPDSYNSSSVFFHFSCFSQFSFYHGTFIYQGPIFKLSICIFSAKDENEVGLCIKELKVPSFYPLMISIWITDSFERKDMERDLLTKLLINLANPRDGMLSPDQFIKGFEYVLTGLEDAVSDAPRAAEFLGRIFAQVILEDIVSFSEIGRLIYEGGEEQGHLVKIGLAAEVLDSILETIKTEKGDSTLSDIRSSSNLKLENFRPPGSNKSWRIDKFL